MIRLLIGLFLSILLIILLIQNLQIASFNFLFWSFEASLSIMLMLTIILTITTTIIIFLPFMLLNKLNKKKQKQILDEISKPKDQAA